MSRGGSSSFHLPQLNSSNVVLHQEPNGKIEQWMQFLSYKDKPLRVVMQLGENSIWELEISHLK